MDEFVKGILDRNEDGATYESIVYDRVLTVRHLRGRLLSVFDPEAISDGLPVDKIYEMLLQPLIPISAHYSPMQPSDLESSEWMGEVIALRWQAVGRTFRRAIPNVYEREWMLLATPLGQVLVSRGSIDAQIAVGGYIRWRESRLDLVAVV